LKKKEIRLENKLHVHKLNKLHAHAACASERLENALLFFEGIAVFEANRLLISACVLMSLVFK